MPCVHSRSSAASRWIHRVMAAAALLFPTPICLGACVACHQRQQIIAVGARLWWPRQCAGFVDGVEVFHACQFDQFPKIVRVHECERIAHSLVCSRTDVHSRVRNECGDSEAKHSILRRHRSHTTLSLSTTPLAPVLTVTKRGIFF